MSDHRHTFNLNEFRDDTGPFQVACQVCGRTFRVQPLERIGNTIRPKRPSPPPPPPPIRGSVKVKLEAKYPAVDEPGATRVVRRFLWFPVELTGERRWLEMANVEQVWTRCSRVQEAMLGPHCQWVNVRFVESKDNGDGK